MNDETGSRIKTLEFGDVQEYRNLTVLPLFLDRIAGPEYVTLPEALASGRFRITEVDEGGSVPDLVVFNEGDAAVLILDGEEVRGAKQNRVLNATVLIGPGSKVVIPVSCVEQGRWSYRSREFTDSDTVMYRRARVSKMSAVSETLYNCSSFSGDQGAVWNDIENLQEETKTHSRTGAMGDVFEEKRENIDDYVGSFQRLDGQAGLLALIDGKPAGLDVLSRPGAFTNVHEKLLRSYAMDALVQADGKKGRQKRGKASRGGTAAEIASAFLASTGECHEERSDSVGMGDDYRYRGPGIVGCALVVEGVVVHAAFFPNPEGSDSSGRIRSAKMRARNMGF